MSTIEKENNAVETIRYKTLIDELEDIVDSKHINQVKKVIENLTKINNFKVELLYTKEIEMVYKKIATFLSVNFHIINYKIVQNIHNIEEIKYESGHSKVYGYMFRHPLNNIGSLEFYLNNEHLEKFERVYLNTFLDEVIGVLYTKYVLNELQHSTYVDHLTKLKNRQSFEEDMKEFIPLAIREDMKLGVLIVNIDRFRAVNDEHGTNFGDEFLKTYATVIKETIRSSDIAVRFGGGEFLIILVNVLDDSKVLEIAQKIKERLAETYLISPYGDKFFKTVCVGISMFPEDSEDIKVVIKNAQMALIDAQDQGRNRIVKYVEPESGGLDFF